MHRAWRAASVATILIAVASAPANLAAQPQPQPQPQTQIVDPSPDYHPPKKRISPFAAYATAQQTNPLAKFPVPRTADGNPDLTGFWGGIASAAGPGGIRVDGSFEPDQAALQRASGWEKPLYKPEFWDKVRGLDFSKVDVDTTFSCFPPGVPRTNAPAQIIQTPTQIVLIYGGLRTRVVPMDGRKLTATDEDMSTFDGISVGRWEGDTLVVDSVGFNDISWIQWQGYFHTNLMKVTERFRRQGNLLFYDFTVHDPDVLMEPWTQGTLVQRLLPAGGRIGEADPCVVMEPVGDVYMRG